MSEPERSESRVARGAPGCTCGTPPFAPPEPSPDCPYHGGHVEPMSWAELASNLQREKLELREVLANVQTERDSARVEVERLTAALEHIAQSVGARANGQDARLMARYAREVL